MYTWLRAQLLAACYANCVHAQYICYSLTNPSVVCRQCVWRATAQCCQKGQCLDDDISPIHCMEPVHQPSTVHVSLGLSLLHGTFA